MKKQFIIISGIIVILVVAGALYWWFGLTNPTSEEVSTATQNIKKVDANILDVKTTQEIENRKVMGNIPVEVSDNYNHSNPFE